LLTEGEVFENEILSRTESTDNPAQKMPEGNSHGKNLIGTSQIELGVKLLILRVFDPLANDSRVVNVIPMFRQLSETPMLHHRSHRALCVSLQHDQRTYEHEHHDGEHAQFQHRMPKDRVIGSRQLGYLCGED
jgi:hypothetical protein